MRNLRRIDVLLNEETGERFDKGDIVIIKTFGGISKLEYVGKIDFIETLELTLDMSREYNCRREKFKFEEISSIQKVE